MNTLLIASIIMFLLSIISFFIKNGMGLLTLKQIIGLSGHILRSSNSGYLLISSTLSDLLLIASVVTLIIYFDYPALVEFFGGLIVLFMQKITILLIVKLAHSNNS